MTIAAGPGARRFDGEFSGWDGPVRHFVGALTKSDTTIYDPPLRMLRVTGAGDVALVLDADGSATVNSEGGSFVIAVGANVELRNYAIRAVLSTGTTATGLQGFR